jgi:hypothetical protein
MRWTMDDGVRPRYRGQGARHWLCSSICEPQFEEDKELLAWAYSKLAYRSFSDMDDCLKMDQIKLMFMGAR